MEGVCLSLKAFFHFYMRISNTNVDVSRVYSALVKKTRFEVSLIVLSLNLFCVVYGRRSSMSLNGLHYVYMRFMSPMNKRANNMRPCYLYLTEVWRLYCYSTICFILDNTRLKWLDTCCSSNDNGQRTYNCRFNLKRSTSSS